MRVQRKGKYIVSKCKKCGDQSNIEIDPYTEANAEDYLNRMRMIGLAHNDMMHPKYVHPMKYSPAIKRAMR